MSDTTAIAPTTTNDHSTLIIGVTVIVILIVVVGVLIALSIWAYDDYNKKKATATPSTKSNSNSNSGSGTVHVNTTGNYPLPLPSSNIQTYIATSGGTSSDGTACYSAQSTGTTTPIQTVAQNANAVGWKLVNNSNQTITLNASAYFNTTNCNVPTGTVATNITLATIGPNSTTNWYDNPKRINNVNYYYTLYPGMGFYINNSPGHLLPSLNTASQYIVITVNPFTPNTNPGSLTDDGTVSVANADGTPV
jgi:hypothetical protein